MPHSQHTQAVRIQAETLLAPYKPLTPASSPRRTVCPRPHLYRNDVKKLLATKTKFSWAHENMAWTNMSWTHGMSLCQSQLVEHMRTCAPEHMSIHAGNTHGMTWRYMNHMSHDMKRTYMKTIYSTMREHNTRVTWTLKTCWLSSAGAWNRGSSNYPTEAPTQQLLQLSFESCKEDKRKTEKKNSVACVRPARYLCSVEEKVFFLWVLEAMVMMSLIQDSSSHVAPTKGFLRRNVESRRCTYRWNLGRMLNM